ncbi:MAG: hypothetical protein QM795_14035 [Pseudoxanthomonas sp.]
MRDYQKRLVKSFGPDEPATVEQSATPGGEQIPRWQLLCALALAVLTLLVWLIPRLAGACQDRVPDAVDPIAQCPTCVVIGPIKPVTYKLQTDTLFDFNTHESMTNEHFKKSKEHLTNFLSAFDGVKILAIHAHTDPIGGDTANRDLATRRAGFLHAMLEQVMATPSHPEQFATTDLPELSVSSGPARKDKVIWDACYDKFYVSAKRSDGLLPLDDLALGKRHGRPVCSEGVATGDGYPACSRLGLPKPGTRVASGYPLRAERFRELTSCLAPMRYAYFEFTFTGLHRPSLDRDATR